MPAPEQAAGRAALSKRNDKEVSHAYRTKIRTGRRPRRRRRSRRRPWCGRRRTHGRHPRGGRPRRELSVPELRDEDTPHPRRSLLHGEVPRMRVGHGAGVAAMDIAIASGKGGTGKTFVSVNLAAVAGQAVYVDCDVEEPNGRLFFKPENPKEESVFTLLPTFDETKCNGCRKCVDFCRFNALVFVKNKPMVFPEICHACGGCVLVCPNGAVSETKRTVGVIETGQSGEVRVVTGVLNTGEASGIPVIKAVLHKADPDGLTVVDCPPGSSCSVMESVFDADFCILVAEPTAFGLHNLEMVYKLVRIFKKPLGIVINKADEPYRALETFCAQNQIPILCRIPYSNKLATLCAHAEIAVMQDSESRRLFTQLLEIVCKEMGVQV